MIHSRLYYSSSLAVAIRLEGKSSYWWGLRTNTTRDGWHANILRGDDIVCLINGIGKYTWEIYTVGTYWIPHGVQECSDEQRKYSAWTMWGASLIALRLLIIYCDRIGNCEIKTTLSIRRKLINKAHGK